MKLSEYIKEYGDKQVDIEKLNEFIIEDKVWLPKINDWFYYVNLLGKVCKAYYENSNTNNAIISLHKVFKTKEEAQFEANKQKFLLFMEREFIRNSDVIDWGNHEQIKHHIYYNYNYRKTFLTTALRTRYGDIYTTNEKWLEQFIKEHKDDIKKYYFEIKE